MNAESDAPTNPDISSNTRLFGWRLWIAWAIWAVVAVLVFYVAATTIPDFVRQALHGGPMTEHVIQNGISPAIYFPLEFSLSIIQLAALYLVALFIVFKRPDDWMVLAISSITLVTGYFFGCFDQVFPDAPSASWLIQYKYLDNLAQVLDIVSYGAIFLFCGTFPDGRFVPRWLKPVFICLFAYVAVEDMLIIINPNVIKYSDFSNTIRFAVIHPLLIFALLYHLRYISIVQRQQTKLAVLGFILAIVGNIIDNLFLNEFGQTAYLILRPVSFFLYICSAICFLYAVLRYHLWDIDFIINRSLVYGALTICLGVILVGGFFALRTAIGVIFGSKQELIAVTVSAIVATALFTPMRNQVRRFVDQRIYGIGLDYKKVVEHQVLKHKRQQSSHDAILSFGPYTDLELVGRGGMSEVYRARHPTLNCDVAIKILTKYHVEDDVARRRFEHEARAISQMRHANIVNLYEYDELDGTPFMILEFLEGHTLSQILKEKGRLRLAEALPLLQDIASALDYAHARGIVHRDIKPSNVIVENKVGPAGEAIQRAVLTDFGIAKLYDAATHLTTTGGLIGTLEYVSPEQIQGSSEVDARSDIYSFGVMVYELLTGRLPFEHKNPGAMVMAHLVKPAPDPRTIVTDLPESAAAALMQAMAKNPQTRQRSVGELVKALEYPESEWPLPRRTAQAALKGVA